MPTAQILTYGGRRNGYRCPLFFLQPDVLHMTLQAVQWVGRPSLWVHPCFAFSSSLLPILQAFTSAP